MTPTFGTFISQGAAAQSHTHRSYRRHRFCGIVISSRVSTREETLPSIQIHIAPTLTCSSLLDCTHHRAGKLLESHSFSSSVCISKHRRLSFQLSVLSILFNRFQVSGKYLCNLCHDQDSGLAVLALHSKANLMSERF